MDGAIRIPLFDGHQDILSQLARADQSNAEQLFLSHPDFHLSKDKCQRGNWRGGFFAMWVPSPADGLDVESMMLEDTYDVPLPLPLDQRSALRSVVHQAAVLLRLQAMGVLQICTGSAQLRNIFASEKLAAIMHLEGCDAIDEDFHALELLYAAGLRSLGPVWSRPTIFAEGVPFRFPSTPDIGGGLTELGRELIIQCNTKGMVIDLSHINLAGFNDVAKLSRHPLIASHSNAHALCNHARNLTDTQLEAIAASKGLVGLNFACAFLRSDGRMSADTKLDLIIRHLDYLLEKLGEEGVGIGSDFDGATVPDAIADAAGLPVLVNAMLDHGYGRSLVSKLCNENWLSVIERTWLE